MKGEELEGLSLEKLQQIEKRLEAGLTHVLEIKVFSRYCTLLC